MQILCLCLYSNSLVNSNPWAVHFFFQSLAGFLSLIINNPRFVDLFLVALKTCLSFPILDSFYCIACAFKILRFIIYSPPPHVGKKDFSFSYIDKMKKTRKLG